MENTHLFHVLEQVGFYFVPHKKHKSKTTELMPRTLRKTFLLPLAAAAAAGLWSCHDDDTVYIIREIPTVAINDTWEHNDTSRAVSTGYISNLHPFGATLVGFINQRDELADTANIMSYGFQFCSDTTYAKIDQLLRQQDTQQAQQEIETLWILEGWKVEQYAGEVFTERYGYKYFSVLRNDAKFQASVICSVPGVRTFYRAFVTRRDPDTLAEETVFGEVKSIGTSGVDIETFARTSLSDKSVRVWLRLAWNANRIGGSGFEEAFKANHNSSYLTGSRNEDEYFCLYCTFTEEELPVEVSFSLSRGYFPLNAKGFTYDFVSDGTTLFQESIEKSEIDQVPEVSTDELVDLGLSVRWASQNIDGLYMWMDTVSMDVEDRYSSTNITDWKSRQRADIAYEKTGGKMRMPTEDEMDELLEKCTFCYYDNENVACIGPNGNMILFPLYVKKQDTRYWVCKYWTSTMSYYYSYRDITYGSGLYLYDNFTDFLIDGSGVDVYNKQSSECTDLHFVRPVENK